VEFQSWGNFLGNSLGRGDEQFLSLTLSIINLMEFQSWENFLGNSCESGSQYSSTRRYAGYMFSESMRQ